MTNLLPSKDEILPIKIRNTTFYDCDFTKPFDQMPFIKKLQIINDIVRQSILPKMINNPEDEIDTLIGNCHTACFVSIEYLRSLNIGTNYKIVLAKHKPFDPDDITTKHTILLVDDNIGNTYEFDATPYVGYGYGTVKKLDNKPLYDEYFVLDDVMINNILKLRIFVKKINDDLISPLEIKECINLLEELRKYKELNGLVSWAYKILYLSKYSNQKYLKNTLLLNPYDNLNEDKSFSKIRLEFLCKQIKLWQEELNDLICSNRDYKRQLQLAQYIVHETKIFDASYDKYLEYNNKKIPISFLTPRFYYENQLNVVAIKPSAYFLGVSSTIKETILHKGKGEIGIYSQNISKPTNETGIVPMLFSHPLGELYKRSMDGTTSVFLIKEDAQKLKQLKYDLRDSLGKNYYYKEVIWTDHEPILWHPFVTNLLHSTDSPSEAALHYAMGYPEHQVMTRFMYPNPVLERKLIK